MIKERILKIRLKSLLVGGDVSKCVCFALPGEIVHHQGTESEPGTHPAASVLLQACAGGLLGDTREKLYSLNRGLRCADLNKRRQVHY